MLNSVPQGFGANLADERRTQGLTMRKLAELAGMSSSEISRLESGRRDPRLSTVIRVARALEVSVADLLRGVG
jgi:HTH-type transcriptional regulator, competence development regulator